MIILMSPAFQSADSALIKLSSPGIFSIPVGFLVMWLVSLATQPKGEERAHADELFERIHIQAVTGYDPRALQAPAEEVQAAAHRA
jgi:Na+(H+)/acetate symporter ActP